MSDHCLHALDRGPQYNPGAVYILYSYIEWVETKLEQRLFVAILRHGGAIFPAQLRVLDLLHQAVQGVLQKQKGCYVKGEVHSISI